MSTLFITVTRQDNGEKLLINVGVISCVSNVEGGSNIYEANSGMEDSYWKVKETRGEVASLIYDSKSGDLYQSYFIKKEE